MSDEKHYFIWNGYCSTRNNDITTVPRLFSFILTSKLNDDILDIQPLQKRKEEKHLLWCYFTSLWTSTSADFYNHIINTPQALLQLFFQWIFFKTLVLQGTLWQACINMWKARRNDSIHVSYVAPYVSNFLWVSIVLTYNWIDFLDIS